MSLDIIDNITGSASNIHTSWVGTNICPNCGKPYNYVGDVPLNGWPKGCEPYCTCNSKLTEPINYGWICPRCGKVNAPFVSQCNCHLKTQATTNINDTGISNTITHTDLDVYTKYTK